MSATTKESFMTFYVIRDDTSGEYTIGDIEGKFSAKKLREYLVEHGPNKLYKQINVLKTQIINEMVGLNIEEEL